ncbi:polysaccharide biosynthesis protein, partial [Micromonospora chalcea]
MDREASTAVRPHRRITHRAATLSLLTLDTAAWCGGFLGAAWTRYEFDLTVAASARTLGLALACAALYAALTLLRSRVYGRYPIGSSGDAQGLAVTVALVAAVGAVAVMQWTRHPVPASTPLVGGTVALVVMAT